MYCHSIRAGRFAHSAFRLSLLALLVILVPRGASADASLYASAVLADAPIGYWKLDDSQAIAALDSSGNAAHGTYFGGLTLEQPGAMSGSNAVAFDGSTGYVTLPGSFGGSNEITVEAWINTDALTPDFNAIVSATDSTFVHFQAHTCCNNAVYRDAGVLLVPVIPTAPISTWRHVALVVAENLAAQQEVRVFVDGVQVGTTTVAAVSPITVNSAVQIARGFGGGRWFDGLIDEVAIYDHALTGAQLQQHVAAAAAPVGYCSDGIVQPGLGEQCDDGGIAGGDGCDATCQFEVCGNGLVDVGEACDDGNVIEWNGSGFDSCPMDCGPFNWRLATSIDGHHYDYDGSHIGGGEALIGDYILGVFDSLDGENSVAFIAKFFPTVNSADSRVQDLAIYSDGHVIQVQIPFDTADTRPGYPIEPTQVGAVLVDGTITTVGGDYGDVHVVNPNSDPMSVANDKIRLLAQVNPSDLTVVFTKDFVSVTSTGVHDRQLNLPVDPYEGISAGIYIARSGEPVIDSLTANLSVYVGESFGFSVQATDWLVAAANGLGRTDYSWDLDGDGSHDDHLLSAGTHSFNAVGQHVIAVKISNTFGYSVESSFTVDVTEPCGNGLLDAGEGCDDGNLANGDCCSSSCSIEPAATVCRFSAGVCDPAESCNGINPFCPADGFVVAGSVCRASADVCDAAETCTGVGAACPADGFVVAGSVCRASAGACDSPETCTGVGAACPGDAKLISECRASADVCDIAETCDGVGNDCPTDAFELPGTECRASAGACDAPDFCSGGGAACTADAKLISECRASADICDIAETCDGVGNDCPTDAFEPGSTECRATAGACDTAEQCTGSDPSCPADSVLNGVACADGDVCNGDEMCVVGVCTPGSVIDCTDGNQCTADSCDEVTGCGHAPILDCVVLQNGTADFSQGGYSPDQLVDEISTGGFGWSTFDGIGSVLPHTAVWETSTDLDAAELEFVLDQNFGFSFLLGRFRLSVTSADRSTFADGLANGGDVDAYWTVLTAPVVGGPAGMTFTVLPDSSVLAGGSIPSTATYTVQYAGSFQGITGVRLETLADPSLPSNGPGWEGAQGSFVVTEMRLNASGTPVAAVPSLDTPALVGLALLMLIGGAIYLPTTKRRGRSS